MLNKFLKYSVSILLLLTFSTGIMTAQDLSTHQCKNRILIIDFDEANQKNYIEQIRDLKAHQAGLHERKLVVYQIRDDKYCIGLDDHSKWQKITNEDFQKIKKKTSSNFSVSLIGLDGGIKKQQTTVFSTNKLFRIIDSMPMRRWELREMKKNK